jgi:predicted nucleic acid-binding protein
MITAIDTNILLALLIPGDANADRAERMPTEADAAGTLILGEAVYAELTPQFPDSADLDRFLAETGLQLTQSGVGALIIAGHAWGAYARQRPQGFVCSNCGTEQSVACQRCGAILRGRQHILADFLVGGHAHANADRLLTFDPRFYRAYFPALRLQ